MWTNGKVFNPVTQKLLVDDNNANFEREKIERSNFHGLFLAAILNWLVKNFLCIFGENRDFPLLRQNFKHLSFPEFLS